MFCLCRQYTGQDAQRKKVKVILSCAKYDFCQVCAGIVGEGFIPPVNHTGSRPMKSTTVCRGRIYAARGLPGDCRLRGTCGRHICRPYMSALFFAGFHPRSAREGFTLPGCGGGGKMPRGVEDAAPPTPVGANIVRLRSLAVATKLSN